MCVCVEGGGTCVCVRAFSFLFPRRVPAICPWLYGDYFLHEGLIMISSFVMKLVSRRKSYKTTGIIS